MPATLPPAMDQTTLVQFILADLKPRQRTALRPGVESAVEAIFAARGRPRTILTPLAVNLAQVRALKHAENDHG